MIGAEERGLLIDNHDPVNWDISIRRLLSDAVLRVRLVDAARKFARNNDVDSMTERYVALYDFVLCKEKNMRAHFCDVNADM